MATCVSITIRFENREIAEAARTIAERMIKLRYVPDGTVWKSEAEEIPSLCNRYFRFGSEADRLDPVSAHPFCALRYLHLEGQQLVLEHCADIQSPVDIFRPSDYFTQLCLVLSKRFPDTVFTAVCRHEMTVTATLQRNRIVCYRGRMTYEEVWSVDEEEDIDENDFSRTGKMMLYESDGLILLPER